MGGTINKKSLLIGLSCYLLWGILPFYWLALENFDALFILANRIIWSLGFALLLLVATKQLPAFVRALKNRRVMTLLLPAAVLITVNWGVYIWAVNHGHILDSSLGYYMNPLVTVVFGLIFFKERCSKGQWLALGLALIGVLYSTVQYGSFPYISVTLALTFAAYGVMKKKVSIDPIISIAIETLLVTPVAIGYILFAGMGSGGLADVGAVSLLLLVGAGVVTATPLMLFARGVNDLPLYVMGFLQYVSPTMSLLIGLFMGETLTPDKLVCFGFIVAGLAVFSFSTFRSERKSAAAPAARS